MAKTYTIPCSKKTAYRNESAYYTQYPYDTSNYYAGKNIDYVYGVNCLFSGLADINASAVTGITVHVQRKTGGTNITYSVNLCYSVLVSDASTSLQTGSTQFNTNKVEWKWPYDEDATGGEYSEISLGTSLFANLRDYGFAVAGRPDRPDNNRWINIGDVYLTITTNEVDTYTVTYNKGSYGTGTNTTATKTQGTALTLKGAIFTRTGYTQKGWSLNANGSSKKYELNGSYTTDAAVTLYPYWVANTYTVTFNPNGGTVSPTTQTVTYGSAYGTLPTPTRTGGTFGGWMLNGKLVTATTVCSTASNHTLTAYWSSITCLYVKSADGSMKPGWVFRKKSDGTMATAVVYQKNADGTITS